MYLPEYYEEKRLDALHALMAAHPLATVFRQDENGLMADHIPFEICAPGADAPFGTLRAHVARANPLWRQDGCEALTVFQAPSAYISPSLYDEKAISGKVVPTWNYAVVHAHGRLRTVDDPQWLLALLGRLTARHEATRAEPWSVEDAPPQFIDQLLRAVIGIEIVIGRLEGKSKLGQDDPRADQVNIAAALGADPRTAALGAMMRAATEE